MVSSRESLVLPKFSGTTSPRATSVRSRRHVVVHFKTSALPVFGYPKVCQRFAIHATNSGREGRRSFELPMHRNKNDETVYGNPEAPSAGQLCQFTRGYRYSSESGGVGRAGRDPLINTGC